MVQAVERAMRMMKAKAPGLPRCFQPCQRRYRAKGSPATKNQTEGV